MKRMSILLTAALLSATSTNLDAKVVRGYVTDQPGRRLADRGEVR